MYHELIFTERAGQEPLSDKDRARLTPKRKGVKNKKPGYDPNIDKAGYAFVR